MSVGHFEKVVSIRPNKSLTQFYDLMNTEHYLPTFIPYFEAEGNYSPDILQVKCTFSSSFWLVTTGEKYFYQGLGSHTSYLTYLNLVNLKLY